MLNEDIKRKVFGTDHEYESHIKNVFRVFGRNPIEFPPRSLLDIGCGRGERTVRVAKYFGISSSRVLGIEYNEEALKSCKNYIHVLKLDLETGWLPCRDNSFDLVVCNQVLEHLKKYKKVIEEIIRVTKPDGYILIGIPNLAHLINRFYLLFGIQPMCIHLNGSHVRGFTHKDFKKLLKSYSDIHLIDSEGAVLYPLPYFVARSAERYLIGLTGYICYFLRKVSHKVC